MTSFVAGVVIGFVGLYLFFVWYYWDIPIPIPTGLYIQDQALESVPYLCTIAGMAIAATILIDYYVHKKQKYILDEGTSKVAEIIKKERERLINEFKDRSNEVRAKDREIDKYKRYLDEREYELRTLEEKLEEQERRINNKKRDLNNARGAAKRRKEQLEEMKNTKDV